MTEDIKSDAPSLRESPAPARKPTAAMLSVLRSHAAVHPRPVGWTIDLCQYRTWRRCYDDGLLYGGRLTNAGLAADRYVAERAAAAVTSRKDGSSQQIEANQ